MSDPTQGGPAAPAASVTDRPVAGAVARPVAAASGQATQGGPAGAPALVFAGAQRVSHDGDSDGQAEFALETWAWKDAPASNAEMWVGSDADPSNYYVNIYPGPNRITCYLESGLSNATLADEGQNTPTGEWLYVVIIKRTEEGATRFRLYVNGAEVDNNVADLGPDPTPGYGWQVGNSTIDEPLTGRVHQCAWWSTAPTDQEIADRYAAGPRAADGEGF